MIMKTMAELRNARRKAPVHSFHLIVRYTNTPVNSATIAVIAPASTTDAMPPMTEPTKTTGISRANEDRYNSFPARRIEKFSSLRSKLYFTAK